MKLFTLAAGLVSVVSCLLLASFSASSSSKRVDLVLRNEFNAKSIKLSIEEMLKREHDRIAFIEAKLHVGQSESEQPMQSSTQTPLYSGQTIGAFNYIMKVGLGTPANDLLLVIDTGSDLAWTQCLPCDVCFQQQDPIFNPAASSSYKQVPCASGQCAHLSYNGCSKTNATNCEYFIPYLDGSYTTGDFAHDTLIVGGDPVSAAYPFGCGHQNEGLFKGMDGILGLSRDELSFPAQTKAEFGEVFAYCMPDIFALSAPAGYIEFGEGGGGSGGSTPLVMLSKTALYVVEVEDVEVEGSRSRKSKAGKSRGMVVVDSGTVITRLDTPLYEEVRDAFKEASAKKAIKEAPEGAGMGVFDACYIVSHGEVLFPTITFTFMGGLAFTPSAQTSVIGLDDNVTFCLALLPLDGLSILGNYQQQGRLFTFDIAHSSLSISPHVAC